MAKQQALVIPERALGPEQAKALDFLAEGKTDAEAGAAAGVDAGTVAKWRRYDPQFIALLNRRKQDSWTSSADRLRALVPKALDALADELESGQNKAQVALAVLKLAGMTEPSEPRGKVTAAAVIDDLAGDRWASSLSRNVTDYERRAVLAELAQGLGESTP